MSRVLVAAVAVVAFAAMFVACSPRKNNAATRNYQAFITRYNIYYNGDTHYKETLKEMESAYEDDYSRLMFIHPAAAKADERAPQPNGNFDRSIEKAQKAIQIRSIKKKPRKKQGKASDPKQKEWLKRDEYNPFLHNAWLMMGRSQYMNGDFLGAASTFFYISKHFTWLPVTVTESKLWEARSYCALDWLFEAESILTRVKPEQLVNKELKMLYYTAYADFYVKSQEWAKAIDMLRRAIPLTSGSQKTRLNFLLGQLLQRTGDNAAAYKAYAKAGASNSATYRTKFNARIKQSEVYTGSDIEPEVKALRRMVRYDRNKEYLDQVYYAIGNLYLSRGDTTQAIENYELAVEKSTRSGIDKAIAQITLGGLYYDRHLYAKAQPCYSEAMSQIPETWPDYRTLKRRSDVLDELAVYSQNVELQDSLLRLSAMTPEQQLDVVNKIIDELKKKEKEEADAAAREEFLAQNDQNGLQDNKTQTFTMNNGDDSWYFYNTAAKNSGRTEFQRRWGNRKLEDDWRRRNKASFNFNDFDTPAEGEEGDENTEGKEAATDSIEENPELAKREQDPHYPEYYLKQIPKTDLEKQTSNDIIQEGLYNMGVILKDKMEDFPASEAEFEELLRRYPDNVYRLDAYYNMYLMYMRAGNRAKAEKYRQLILTDFPESAYGIAMKDPEYIEQLRRMQQVENQYYDQALEAYLDNSNADVHAIYNTVKRDYPLTKLMPRFMFLEALTCVSDRKPDEFNAILREMLERYPDTDLAPYASSYLKGMAQGRELQQGLSNMRGMLWDIKLGSDSTATSSDPVEFTINPQEEQLLVLLFPTDVISQNALLYNIARHNFTSFMVKDFDLEQMNFGRLGLLIIKGFDNVDEINYYLKVLNESAQLKLPSEVRPVVISKANFDKMLQSGRSFDDYFNYMRDKTYEETQQSVLPEELIESLREAEEAEARQAEAAGKDAGNPDAEVYEEESLPEKEEDIIEEVPDETEPEVIPAPDPTVAPEAEPQKESEAVPGSQAKPELVPEPEAKPEAAPQQSPQPAKEAPEHQQPQPATPTPKKEVPAPAPATKPVLPDYPEGSEGDDPLLD